MGATMETLSLAMCRELENLKHSVLNEMFLPTPSSGLGEQCGRGGRLWEPEGTEDTSRTRTRPSKLTKQSSHKLTENEARSPSHSNLFMQPRVNSAYYNTELAMPQNIPVCHLFWTCMLWLQTEHDQKCVYHLSVLKYNLTLSMLCRLLALYTHLSVCIPLKLKVFWSLDPHNDSI